MSMIDFWKFLHVLSAALFAGAVLTMLAVQSLLQRTTDDGDRKSLASAASSVGRLVVNPTGIAAFVFGVVYWLKASPGGGLGNMLACTQIYVHIMMLFGFLAVGMAQAWKGQTRRLVAAIEGGKPAVEVRRLISSGWIFAFLAFGFIVVIFACAVLHFPHPPLLRCNLVP